MPGYARAARAARRLYPLALEAYRRWDRLSDNEKDQYKRQAKRYTTQALALARDATSRTAEQLRKRRRR